ncbi:MAG: diphosphate--fructose-6-phosphate 1-phosphotransferase [Spirochaetae bacterium HGW-Spirochaetae-7]|jgi:pyrophosphate--fructose-6-phosphate 1-phosphotransferase|nr:MAG: diphosphate--fructose-6-phosphate 1-phosphotransferase [Spirochaetae bacterium HGW-Spirochaetae-7]
MELSPLQLARYAYIPKIPSVLSGGPGAIAVELGGATESIADREALRSLFPGCYGKPVVTFARGDGKSNRNKLNVGVILSGGQAPGGHNVIAGLFDGLSAGNPDSVLLGFKGGPLGLVDDDAVILDAATIAEYRNTGGFDIIGSGRTKIETPEQFARSVATARSRALDAIVVIGGDDSNTNAALLAEHFLREGVHCSVIGVPKTIDGDLKNDYIETSFGFDTATKTYAELIGNIERDAASARKYWHFIKLMGRSASHIALECALQCRPNVALVSEEIEAGGQTLADVTETICASIAARAGRGMNFGVVLIPEGLIEFIPDFKVLIAGLNDMMAARLGEFKAQKDDEARDAFIRNALGGASGALYSSLPVDIRRQLIMDRDPHGNVQVSRIETEKLLIAMVEVRLAALKAQGKYSGAFSSQAHFFGYEGRCAFPSNFDADYCYALGYSAFALIANGFTGYLSSVRNLSAPAVEWVAGGVPLTMMMNMERRHGSDKPVIRKALVELDGAPFKSFAAGRARWSVETSYRFPGAIQYYGPAAVCDRPTETLLLEHPR